MDGGPVESVQQGMSSPSRSRKSGPFHQALQDHPGLMVRIIYHQERCIGCNGCVEAAPSDGASPSGMACAVT